MLVSENEDKPLSYLTKEAKSLYKMGQLKSSAQMYEAIEINYPASKEVKPAMKRLLSIYKRLSDEESFLDVSERYLVRYPNERTSDEIYWLRAEYSFKKYQSKYRKYLMLGQADHDKKVLNTAKLDYQYIVHNFKHSTYYSKAKQRLSSIEGLMASHDLAIAEFYLNKNNKKAAIQRARNLLKVYPKVSKDIRQRAKDIIDQG